MNEISLKIVPDWIVNYAVSYDMCYPFDVRYQRHNQDEKISEMATCCGKLFKLKVADKKNQVVLGQCRQCHTIHYTAPSFDKLKKLRVRDYWFYSG